MKEDLYPIYQCKCGKRFCLSYSKDYAWKIQNKFYCSYTCWNKDFSKIRTYGRYITERKKRGEKDAR